ncbi:MAG TPA: hypothetical protein VMH34_07270 [Gammaproteobacteria bacterium]|nr:hypothetical protein [Gammaproteobacteria bacterium]
MTTATAALPISAGDDRHILWVPALLIALFASLTLFPRIAGSTELSAVFADITAILAALYGIVVTLVLSGRRTPRFSVLLRPSHYVQAMVHSSIFIYWGWYWHPVYEEFVLIVSQIVFVYVLEALIAWLRGKDWQLGFGAFPIIFSTNLFLWFKDDWYAWQFVMVAVGVLGKQFVTWRRDGRPAHIFNPSALSLFIASTILIFTRHTGVSWGNDIANTLNYPEHIYLWIFLVGLIVQHLFGVTLVTVSAAISLLLLGAVWYAATGVYFFFTSDIPIAVFLGMHLLVTDPATSPRTDVGKVIFGALYGASVMALFWLLDVTNVPPFYDKLLPVPFLNLSVRMLDRVARGHPLASLSEWLVGYAPKQRNAAYMGVWMAVFAGLLSTHHLGAMHPGRSFAFWEQACKRGLRNGCRNLHDLTDAECLNGQPLACAKMAVMYRDGTGVEANERRAYRYILRACSLGYKEACDRIDQFIPPPDISLFPGKG